MTYDPKTPTSEEFVYRITNEIRNETNEKIEALDLKLDKKFDMVMNTLDKILGYFKKFDEEHGLLTHRTYENTDRIEKLEKAVFKAS